MSRTIELGLISEGTATWPLYVAQRRHFFEREGIRVNVTVTGSSVEQQEALVGGRFDVGFQQADHVVRAVEKGSDLFIFMAHGHAPELTLVGASSLRGIEDLRGRVIAVDGARTGYALLLRRLLAQHGMHSSDVTFQEVGGSQQRFEAMRSGAVAASLLNPPFDANLVQEGFLSLARMADAFPTYPGSVMAARKGWAKTHDDELLAFIRAYDAAYAWLQKPQNKADALALLPDRLAIAPRAAAGAISKYAQRPKPQLTREGLKQVIDIVWASEGYTQAEGEPDKYMDLSYMTRALAQGKS
jgi:ABC-type nitrate/sulfonate/bicarbonate transport system substrate-binding protein